jgi:beta-glucosidase
MEEIQKWKQLGICDNARIQVGVDIGRVPEEHGPELYLSDLVASVVPAGKKLVGFQKIQLKPFETKRIDFVLSTEAVKFVNNKGEFISEEGFFDLKINQLSSKFQLN